MTLKFNGNTRLEGDVFPSGSVYSSISVLAGSLLANELLLHNVPLVGKVKEFLNSLAVFGVKHTWSAKNSLQLDCSVVTSAEASDPILIAPLLIRLGEVTIKKTLLLPELTQLFKDLEIVINIEGENAVLRMPQTSSKTVNVENNLAASIAALFLGTAGGEGLVINNFLLTEETLDLIEFLKSSGYEVLENQKVYGQLKIKGVTTLPASSVFSLPASSLESAFWASGAVMSFGDVTINNVSRERLISFLSKFTMLGALLIPLMLRASGESRISGIKITDEPYIKDINLFDAKIFSETITGPASLRGVKVAVPDFTGGLVLILAALGSSGRSELLEAEKVCDFFDNLPQKLEQLLH